MARFGIWGENCSAISRLIVHKNVKQELLTRIDHHIKQWNIGDPLDPETRIGALVSTSHFEKVCGYLKNAKKNPHGRQSRDAEFIEPTIIEVDNNQDLLARDEIFGPVLVVITISNFDEAIQNRQ